MKKLPRALRKPFNDKRLNVNKNFKNNLMQQLLQKEPTMATKKALRTKLLFNSRLVSIAAAVAVLGVVGGSSALISSNRAEKAQLHEVELPLDLTGVLPLDQIRTKALELAPASATITGIELEQEDGNLFYKVKFSDGSFRLFNAKTGEAVTSTDQELETDATVPADFVAGFSLQAAREKAQSERPGETIVKIELESEDGIIVYSVRFSDGGRVDISATDGTVVRVRDASNSGSGSSDNDEDDEDDNEDEDDEEDDNSGSNSGSGSDSNSGSDD